MSFRLQSAALAGAWQKDENSWSTQKKKKKGVGKKTNAKTPKNFEQKEVQTNPALERCAGRSSSLLK